MTRTFACFALISLGEEPAMPSRRDHHVGNRAIREWVDERSLFVSRSDDRSGTAGLPGSGE